MNPWALQNSIYSSLGSRNGNCCGAGCRAAPCRRSPLGDKGQLADLYRSKNCQDGSLTYKTKMSNGINSRLETKRLLLRPMLATDIEALHIIFGDPEVMAAFNHPPFTPEQMQTWLQRNLDHQNEYGYGLFSVIHKETGTLIGDCGLEYLESEGAAELGYDFRSDYWNQGYATEAAIAVRDYAFVVLRLPQLISLIRVGNLASKRVAEKVGMRLSGQFTRYGIPYWKYSMQ